MEGHQKPASLKVFFADFNFREKSVFYVNRFLHSNSTKSATLKVFLGHFNALRVELNVTGTYKRDT